MCNISGSVCNISGSERIYIRTYVQYLRQYVLQTMAMVESIWPSEQLATALTSTVDAQSLDPADPQVGFACSWHVHKHDRRTSALHV